MSEPSQLPLEEPTQRCVNPDCNKRGTLDEHGLCLKCRAEVEAERVFDGAALQQAIREELKKVMGS